MLRTDRGIALSNPPRTARVALQRFRRLNTTGGSLTRPAHVQETVNLLRNRTRRTARTTTDYCALSAARAHERAALAAMATPNRSRVLKTNIGQIWGFPFTADFTSSNRPAQLRAIRGRTDAGIRILVTYRTCRTSHTNSLPQDESLRPLSHWTELEN